MRPILSASLLAIVAAVSISACSSSSNSTNTVDATATVAPADNSAAAPADNSAAAPADSSAAAPAAGQPPLYPGAAPDTLPAKGGTPPPGGKSYSTKDSVEKVKAWYVANVKDAKLTGSSPQGAMFLQGDPKTGTVIMVMSDSGKTWILTGPAASMGN
jgi:hypothetical protein